MVDPDAGAGALTRDKAGANRGRGGSRGIVDPDAGAGALTRDKTSEGAAAGTAAWLTLTRERGR